MQIQKRTSSCKQRTARGTPTHLSPNHNHKQASGTRRRRGAQASHPRRTSCRAIAPRSSLATVMSDAWCPVQYGRVVLGSVAWRSCGVTAAAKGVAWALSFSCVWLQLRVRVSSVARVCVFSRVSFLSSNIEFTYFSPAGVRGAPCGTSHLTALASPSSALSWV